MQRTVLREITDRIGGYIGRISQRAKVSLFGGSVYYLEVVNRIGKTKKIRIGTSGCDVGDGSHPVWYGVSVPKFEFTDRGLEADVSPHNTMGGVLFPATETAGTTRVLIPRNKFSY